MPDIEIKKAVDDLGKAFEDFKAANDTRLKEMEANGKADPVTEEKVNKLNDEVERLQGVVEDAGKDAEKKLEEAVAAERAEREGAMDALKTAMRRTGHGGANDGEASEVKDAIAFETMTRTQASGVSSVLREPITVENVDLDAYRSYRDAFPMAIRFNKDDLTPEQTKALSAGSAPDGGLWVSPAVSARVITVENESSPMRALAAVETIGTDSLELMVDKNRAVAGWVAETAARPETGTPQMEKKVIAVHELYAAPRATQKLLDDANVDVEAWLAGKVADEFVLMENTAFVNGDGVGKPRGFLTYPAGTAWGQIEQVVSGTSAVVEADGLHDLQASLKERYQPGASWLGARAVVSSIRKIKDTTDQYLWQPGLAAGMPGTLLGNPFRFAADMPALAADSLSVAYGDFRRAYVIVDRIGIRVLRDPFTAKPSVEFYTTKRGGGDVVNFEAIKLQKLGT